MGMVAKKKKFSTKKTVYFGRIHPQRKKRKPTGHSHKATIPFIPPGAQPNGGWPKKSATLPQNDQRTNPKFFSLIGPFVINSLKKG